MLLCRHLVHRIAPPIRVAHPLSLLFAKITSSKYTVGSSSTLSPSALSRAPNEARCDTPWLPDIPVERLVDCLARLRNPTSPQNICGNAAGQSVEGEMEEVLQQRRKEVMDPLYLYETLRRRDRSALVRLPIHIFLELARRAATTKSTGIAEHLAADALETLADRDRRQLAKELIKHSSMLPNDTIVALLCLLEPDGSRALIGTTLFQSIAAEILKTNAVSEESLKILTARFIVRLSAHKAPIGSRAITYVPPPFIKLSFLLARTLVGKGLDQLTLQLFGAMVGNRNIPPEAIQKTHSGATNFKVTIFVTLIRAALHWHWRRLAVSLLEDLLEIPESDASASSAHALVEEVVFASLNTPSAQDVADSCSLMVLLDNRADDFVVPRGLIKLFYDAAEKLKLGIVAETFYSHTQSPPVLEKTTYPPPEGRALTWLIDYITGTSGNIHLGRRLAKQVVALETPIPYHDRSRFIAIAAMHSYGTESRALWERYSVGKDRDVVIGNAATMIRMTSLFVNIQKRVRSQLEILSMEEDAHAPAPKVQAERVSNEVKRHLSEIERDTTVDPTTLDDPETIQGNTRESFQKRLKDLATFVEYVVHEFRQVKEPLNEATHNDLSSLARAYFMLGNVAAGFETFQVLLDRKEIPDLHDVNIALGVFASYDPKGSARVIETMIKKGLRPDAITFGTVLHHAVLHGEMELVGELVRKSRDLKGHLTLRSISSLIRASVNLDEGNKTKLRSNLEQSLAIIQSLADSDVVCSPNTGKYCISSSLKVDDPVMAFRFWTMLVKRKTEWEDREQVFQRRLIARMIRKHLVCGWIRRDRAMMMLSQLRAKFIIRGSTLARLGRKNVIL
jgi:hypothetical protein